MWNCSFTLSYFFLACCLIQHRTFSSFHLHVSVYLLSSGANPRTGICETLSLHLSSGEAVYGIWTITRGTTADFLSSARPPSLSKTPPIWYLVIQALLFELPYFDIDLSNLMFFEFFLCQRIIYPWVRICAVYKWQCDRKLLIMKRPWPSRSCCAMGRWVGVYGKVPSCVV